MRVLKPKKSSQGSSSSEKFQKEELQKGRLRFRGDDAEIDAYQNPLESLVDVVHLNEASQGNDQLGSKRKPVEAGTKRQAKAFEKEVRQTQSAANKKNNNSDKEPTLTSIYNRGITLLAIREHSALELRNKLNSKFQNHVAVDEVVAQLVKDNYLSDERFTEAYVRARKAKGFGPSRIRNELSSKGIADDLIYDYLQLNSASWLEAAELQYQKKFKNTPINDYREWAKRARFLQGKGFSREHIDVVLPAIVDQAFD